MLRFSRLLEKDNDDRQGQGRTQAEKDKHLHYISGTVAKAALRTKIALYRAAVWLGWSYLSNR